MYAEEDVLEEQFNRSADIRHSRASTIRNSRYISEGFIQYSQPSLNGESCVECFYVTLGLDLSHHLCRSIFLRYTL